MKRKFTLLVVLMCAIMALTGCGAKTINLNDYLITSFSGTNKMGTLNADIDYEKLVSDYAEAAGIKVDSDEYYGAEFAIESEITAECEKDYRLSNGDKCVIKITNPSSLSNKKVKFESQLVTLTVSDLPEGPHALTEEEYIDEIISDCEKVFTDESTYDYIKRLYHPVYWQLDYATINPPELAAVYMVGEKAYFIVKSDISFNDDYSYYLEEHDEDYNFSYTKLNNNYSLYIPYEAALVVDENGEYDCKWIEVGLRDVDNSLNSHELFHRDNAKVYYVPATFSEEEAMNNINSINRQSDMNDIIPAEHYDTLENLEAHARELAEKEGYPLIVIR